MSGLTVFLDGKPVTLAELPLKGGGQAAVLPVIGDDTIVVKLYREPPGPEQERRLTRMLTMSPLAARPTNASQPPELAWPTALARGARGEFLGYAMRRFGEPAHVQLIGLFTRAQRRKLFPERADWRFLLGVAWNLAFMTARMHHDNLVIGDFSSSNVVVDANGFVTFLDCDSITLTDPATGELFPCLMHTTDYSPPERQAGGPAGRATDDFALAVLVYQLLTAGNHPFGGVPHDSASESTVKDNIAASCSYVVRPERVVIPRGTVDPSVLPPELLTLAHAAFGPGVLAPAARPPAEAWLRALNKERSQVRICPTRPLHAYGSHLTSCPWCTRVATTGHDVFNGPAPLPLPDPPPREGERPGGHLRSALKVAALVVLVVVLAIVAKQLGGS
jgi:DNA-binding helix-hairpin-helix protein with protein kinase domain